MIIWKSLIGECLQCVNEPTKEVNKNAVALVHPNSHYKEEVIGHGQQKSLPHFALDIFGTGKRVNHRGE